MNIKELQIGDWVLKRDEGYATVIGIDYLGTVDTSRGITIDMCLKPVPLTPEILELNGFKSTAGRTVWEMEIEKKYINIWGTHALSFSLNVPYLTGYKWVMQDIPINYVHELQHLLRLCGLTELANDFKVE